VRYVRQVWHSLKYEPSSCCIVYLFRTLHVDLLELSRIRLQNVPKILFYLSKGGVMM